MRHYSSHNHHNKRRWSRGIGLWLSLALLSGCTPVFDWLAGRNLDAPQGQLHLPGLQQPVSIRRDAYGVPFVEAQNMADLTFGLGYAMAEDRLAQMVSMNLLARGRLAEMVGPLALDMDLYMRTLGVPQIISGRYATLSDELKTHLTGFSAGVNAYLETHHDRLPLELTLNGYTPEPWQPDNTIGLFVMLNLGVGFNLHEELAFLQIAAHTGTEKAAYLAPVFPDEPIDLAEAAKLDGVTLAVQQLEPQLQFLARVEQQLKRLNGQGLAASNNWAVHKDRTAQGASLVANDTHLLLSHPSTWMLMGARSPEYAGIGIALPGIPALVAGYNGHIGWGETMVMADTQDVFVEQLRQRDGVTEYRYQDAWYPVTERRETLLVKGGEPQTFTVQSTRHGPLLNPALLQQPKHAMIPLATHSEYGLALSWTAQYPDTTIDSFFRLGQARTLDEAEQALNGVGFIHLNVIAADKDNIQWQITGHYPQRKNGTGHFPSPGWSGDYDWTGYWGGASTPRRRNPPEGFVATANDRTVVPGFSPTLTSSWYYPERGERARQLLAARTDHDATNMVAMQADRHDLLIGKVQRLWQSDEWAAMIRAGMTRLSPARQVAAARVLESLLAFDGNMAEDSRAAALWGAFEHTLIRAMFLDELGPADGPLWTALMAMNGRAYSGYQDHLLGRRTASGEWAPFWDDVQTPAQETPGDIIAASLAATWEYLQATLGTDDSRWQWGQLAYYHWQTDSTHMLPWLSGVQKLAVSQLAGYTSRGPYPAGGNRNTLNVAGYSLGQDYSVWNIPAMRLVVDFSAAEPLQLVIAGGQSANPASPHYDDGIALWRSGTNRTLPFVSAQRVREHFHRERILQP